MSTDQPEGEGQAESADYFLEVEAHFAARRGTPFIFSAKDWALLKSWRSDGIPLPVVLEAIDRCFDKRADSGRKGTISSLGYCRHAVKELWEERKDLAVGSESELPEHDPREKLVALASEVLQAADVSGSGAVASLLRDAATRISSAGEARTVPLIEERLMEIESDLLTRVEEAFEPDERAALEREVEDLLAGYAALKPETQKKTRDANLKRLLRRKVGVPRLSLFS